MPRPTLGRACQPVSLIGALLVAFSGVLTTAVSTEAASPTLSTVLPRGGQRGTELEVTLRGARLADAQEILYHRARGESAGQGRAGATLGIETISLKPDEGGQQVKAKLRILPNCRLGEHALRLRTATGISNLATFYVGALPQIDEKEPNNEFASPQKIALNTTVAGVIDNEDVDYFVVDAKKGQRLAVEVEGLRLGTTMFDPYVSILDSKRFELASSDDSTLVFQDCVAATVVPSDGQYIIMIREAAYGGSGESRYRLHVGDFPRPLAVYPAGGPLGQQVEVQLLGDPAGNKTQQVAVPEQPQEDFAVLAAEGDRIAPSGNPFRVFPHGNVLEVEPNNSLKQATPGDLPKALNGVISSDGDQDWFLFSAKKDEVYEIECYARRVRSPLDPVINLFDGQGKSLQGNDDARGPDSYFRFKIPADGKYALRVRDHLGRGGPTHVYRVEFQKVSPALSVTIPEFARYSQERNAVVVPQGNRYATMMSISARDYRGDLKLIAEKLPEGVEMTVPPIPTGINQVPVLFSAAKDASISGLLTGFQVASADGKITGPYRQTAMMVRGPQNTAMWETSVSELAVAVAEEAPFAIELIQPKVPIVRAGSMRLKVVAKRREGFDEAIQVEFPFRPPGINASSRITIPKGKTEVDYPINAAGNAQLKEWKVLCIAQANHNGATWAASNFIDLQVVEPYVALELQRAAVELGETARIMAKATVNREFSGQATVRLVGLNSKFKVEPLEMTKDTQELIFEIPTDKDTPVGKHRNLFCQVVVTENGEPIVHSQGRTELQVDKPLPKPQPKAAEVAKKPQPKTPPASQPKKARPLSRLEKLRLAAQQAAQAAAEKD